MVTCGFCSCSSYFMHDSNCMENMAAYYNRACELTIAKKLDALSCVQPFLEKKSYRGHMSSKRNRTYSLLWKMWSLKMIYMFLPKADF